MVTFDFFIQWNRKVYELKINIIIFFSSTNVCVIHTSYIDGYHVIDIKLTLSNFFLHLI